MFKLQGKSHCMIIETQDHRKITLTQYDWKNVYK